MKTTDILRYSPAKMLIVALSLTTVVEGSAEKAKEASKCAEPCSGSAITDVQEYAAVGARRALRVSGTDSDKVHTCAASKFEACVSDELKAGNFAVSMPAATISREGDVTTISMRAELSPAFKTRPCHTVFARRGRARVHSAGGAKSVTREMLIDEELTDRPSRKSWPNRMREAFPGATFEEIDSEHGTDNAYIVEHFMMGRY